MNIDPVAILFQIINFSILMYLMKRFVYKPVLKILDERASRIKEGLEAAEKNVKMAEKMEADRDKALSAAKKQANAIVADAKKQADEIVKKAQAKAKLQAKKAMETERSAFEAMMAREEKSRAASLASSVVLASKALLEEAMESKQASALIDKQIKKLDLNQFGA